MIKSIDILRETYRLWNDPPQSRLDTRAVVDALNRVYTQRKIEFGLSGGSFLAKVSEPFYVDDFTRTADLSDAGVDEHFLQIRVESSDMNADGSDTVWREVKIGSFADWETFKSSTNEYAAFYGSADSPQMIVNHASANRLYRLIYEPAGALADNGDVEMPAIFQPLLVYDTAIEAGFVLDDDSPEFAQKLNSKAQFLAVRQNEAHALFKKWLASRNSQSVETRMGFNDRPNTFFGIGQRGLLGNVTIQNDDWNN